MWRECFDNGRRTINVFDERYSVSRRVSVVDYFLQMKRRIKIITYRRERIQPKRMLQPTCKVFRKLFNV